MSKSNRNNKNNKKFILLAIGSIAFTMFLSYHISIILFGDNSIEVYSNLKDKKVYLESEIIRLQKENANLQKEYFELKNLEPEQ